MPIGRVLKIQERERLCERERVALCEEVAKSRCLRGPERDKDGARYMRF